MSKNHDDHVNANPVTGQYLPTEMKNKFCNDEAKVTSRGVRNVFVWGIMVPHIFSHPTACGEERYYEPSYMPGLETVTLGTGIVLWMWHVV
jgi:hypothetical protein